MKHSIIVLAGNSNRNGWKQYMNVLKLALNTAAILMLVAPYQAGARITLALSYQEMLSKSDLVVIATPISRTADTEEESFLPGI